MIVITAYNQHGELVSIKYKGNLELANMDSMLFVSWNHKRDGVFTNGSDFFWLTSIVSIRGN